MDINMIKAAAGKYKKYRDLEIVTKKILPKKVHTIPIIIGALGTICQNLNGLHARVSPQANLDLILTEVLLGSAHVLCRTLTNSAKPAPRTRLCGYLSSPSHLR